MQSSSIPLERNSVLAQYEKKYGKNFRVETKPHKSVRPFSFRVVNDGSGVAYAVLNANEPLEFFTYGVGQPIDDGFGNQRNATLADTDLSEGGKTVGPETFVIEGISATLAGVRVKYAAGAPGGADPAVANFYAGKIPGLDPAALVQPPQCASPFNLEAVFMSAMAPYLAIELEWDRTRKTQIGTLDEVPEGGAKSFLRANGEPHPGSRYRVPEGYVWRAVGRVDSNFLVRVTPAMPIVIPISLVTFPGAGAVSVPTGICADIAIRLHGLRFTLPSGN